LEIVPDLSKPTGIAERSTGKGGEGCENDASGVLARKRGWDWNGSGGKENPPKERMSQRKAKLRWMEWGSMGGGGGEGKYQSRKEKPRKIFYIKRGQLTLEGST